MTVKDKIMQQLTRQRMPTSRIAAIVGMRYDDVKKILQELLTEGKVTKQEETLATYWEAKR